MRARDVEAALAQYENPEKAAFFPRFFKTGKGEYGEGDRFVGVVVPDQRRVAKQFRGLPFAELGRLLASPFHEHRSTGVFILALRYASAKTDAERREVYDCTLANWSGINGWDMVDCAGPKIVGPFLRSHPAETERLYAWAASDDLWERRLSMLATFPFIRAGDFSHTLTIAELLLKDEHDLIHKAVGWMLREVGKRDRAKECAFLDAHGSGMPRTMLRYAIEKFPEPMRQRYLGRT